MIKHHNFNTPQVVELMSITPNLRKIESVACFGENIFKLISSLRNGVTEYEGCMSDSSTSE